MNQINWVRHNIPENFNSVQWIYYFREFKEAPVVYTYNDTGPLKIFGKLHDSYVIFEKSRLFNSSRFSEDVCKEELVKQLVETFDEETTFLTMYKNDQLFNLAIIVEKFKRI